MRRIVRLCSFALWMIAIGSWATDAPAQVSISAPCALPSSGAIIGFAPGSPTARKLILQRTIRCLQARGALTASGAPDKGDHFVTFDPPGSFFTVPSGITLDGRITGYFGDASGVQHGFLRTPSGTFVIFDPPGSVRTLPTDLDPAGEITGAYCDTASCAPQHGFVRDAAGAFVTFNAPGTSASIEAPIWNTGGPPPSINLQGTIAGTYSDAHLTEHGFILSKSGALTTIDAPNALSTEVLAINPSGVVVGDLCNSTHCGIGFVRTPDGSFNTINTPGASCGGSIATGVNPAGAIVGMTYDSSCTTPLAYLRSPDGKITTFAIPGALTFAPQAINLTGLITGWFYDAAGLFHAFLRSPNGMVTTIDVPDSFGTLGLGINSAGVIIGIYLDAGGAYHGFARSPGGANRLGLTLTTP